MARKKLIVGSPLQSPRKRSNGQATQVSNVWIKPMHRTAQCACLQKIVCIWYFYLFCTQKNLATQFFVALPPQRN